MGTGRFGPLVEQRQQVRRSGATTKLDGGKDKLREHCVRNEFLSDSKTLIDAEKAYDKSGGSFDAVIVSLLTSDSFIYRLPIATDSSTN